MITSENSGALDSSGESAPVPFEADFLADIRDTFAATLQAAGYKIPPNLPAVKVAELFFNVKHREISQRPRTVLRSRELSRQPLSRKVRRTLKEIESVSLKGHNLNHYLSERLLRPEYNDALLNDWGIHHMHLGRGGATPNGFSPRSRELLFVMARPNTLYFIRVGEHPNEQRDDFCDQELVEVVHRNWPDILQSYHLVGASTVGLTQLQRKTIRSKFVGVTTTVDGTVYRSMGGGQMASGLSMDARIECDAWLTRAHQLETFCRTNASLLHQEVQKHSGRTLAKLELHLLLTEKGMVVVERPSGCRFVFTSNRPEQVQKGR
jgi:hypothetical protein